MQYQVLKGKAARLDINCEGDLSLHPAFCDLHFRCEAVAEFSDAKVLNVVTRSRVEDIEESTRIANPLGVMI